MTAALLLGFAVLLIAANALFVAAEFSLVTVDRALVDRRATEGDRGARRMVPALKRLSTQLSGAQLGITVTSLVVGYIAEPAIASLLRDPIGALGVPEATTPGLAFGVAFVLATGAQMVFGELVPKNWAIAQPMRVGRAVVGFQRGFTALAGPLIRLLNGMANLVLHAMGIEPSEELASARSPSELASLASRSADRGTLEVGTAELLNRSVAFGNRRAADVMTPRPRVQFIDADATATEVLQLAAATGHARFPVTGEGVDDVLGLVHFKHALAATEEGDDEMAVRDLMRELPAVPTSLHLDPLLEVLRSSGPQMAVAVDEYGGTAGIVSLEDLVEEIVGEIEDEQDRPVGRIRALRDGSWSLSGLLRPDEVADLTELRLPESDESDTVGGLLTEELGRLPEAGDTVRCTVQDLAQPDEDGVPTEVGVTLEVLRLDGHRVDRLRMRRAPAEEGTVGDG